MTVAKPDIEFHRRCAELEILMADGIENETDRRDEPSAPVRRPWHAPKFYLTDVASTYNQGGTIPDAGIANGT